MVAMYGLNCGIRGLIVGFRGFAGFDLDMCFCWDGDGVSHMMDGHLDSVGTDGRVGRSDRDLEHLRRPGFSSCMIYYRLVTKEL